MLVAINKDSLMRGSLCVKLHGGRSLLLIALQQAAIYSQLFNGNRDFAYPPAFYAAVRGIDPHRNITITFGTEKLEWCGDPMVKKN